MKKNKNNKFLTVTLKHWLLISFTFFLFSASVLLSSLSSNRHGIICNPSETFPSRALHFLPQLSLKVQSKFDIWHSVGSSYHLIDLHLVEKVLSKEICHSLTREISLLISLTACVHVQQVKAILNAGRRPEHATCQQIPLVEE